MKLESNLVDEEDFKVIAEDCTLAQAFTMIANWCYDNDAKTNWKASEKEAWDANMVIYCIKNNTVVNTFIISE